MIRHKKFFLALLAVIVAVGGLFSAPKQGALIQAMQEASQSRQGSARENLDDVLLKYVPIGTSKETGIAICNANGFQVSLHSDKKGSGFPEADEYIYCTRNSPSLMYLISSKEYRAILYLREGRVAAALGRFFIHSL